MAAENIKSSNPKKRNLRIGRSILAVLVMSLLAVVLIKFYGNKITSGLTANTTTEVPLRYIPAEYESNINEEDAIAVLQNPQRYRREFNDMVLDINTSILRHVAKRMGLSESQRVAVVRDYKNNYHPEFRNLYFRDYMRLRDTTSTLYETWYDDHSASAVEVFNEIASKYTCFLSQQVLSNFIATDESGKFLAQGKKLESPCGIALTEALAPLVKKMEERAAILDFGRSKGLLQEKIEKTIAELATYEIEDKKGISQQQSTKFLGFDVSTSDVEVSAISKIKAGFKIDDYFDIALNSKAEVVTITLPQPKILSHEVYPKFDKLDIGWMREVENQDFNKMINVLRGEFRREAMEEDMILDKAKTKATELMNTLFGPLLASFNPNFKLRVSFQQGEVNPEFEKKEEPQDLNALSN